MADDQKLTKSYAESRLETNMVRTVSWWHVFFIAAGVPAYVLFSMGGISALIGPSAPLAWTLSMVDRVPRLLHLCGDRRPAPSQVRRYRRPRRDRLDPLQPVHGADVAVVQLDRLEPGARHRLRSRGRLPALDLLRAYRQHQHVERHAGEPRLPAARAAATGQLHVHPRSTYPVGRVEHSAPRHPAHGAYSAHPDSRRANAAAARHDHPDLPGQRSDHELHALRAAQRFVEPPRLDLVPGGDVHRGLVDLRVRDRRVLHE